MKSMTLIEKAFFLKKTSLFAELDLDILLSIADKMQMADFDSGEEIFQSGHEAQRMYFVVKGQVVIGDIHLKTLDFFGEESLFNEKPRTYNAVALTDLELLTLSKTHLMAVISEYPLVVITLLQMYAEIMPNRFQR